MKFRLFRALWELMNGDAPSDALMRLGDRFAPQLSTILADARRQHVLAELLAGPAQRTFDSLTTAVATTESLQVAGTAWESKHAAVAATLHHNHLPKLDDEDIIVYDVEERIVELTGVGRTCAEALGIDRAIDDTDSP